MVMARACVIYSIAWLYISMLCTTYAYGQSPIPSPTPDAAVAGQGSESSGTKQAAAQKPSPGDLQKEMADVRSENAAVREQLRKMQQQQQSLMEMIDHLQRRLDGPAVAGAAPAGAPGGATTTTVAPQPPANPTVGTPELASMQRPAQPAAVAAKEAKDARYQDGIVVGHPSEDATVPFLLKFNVNTQIRYLNTTNSSNDTFTDHLGVVRDVHKRNDITVNRSMFILGGYIFDERLRYSSTVWTSAGSASIVVAGNIGWQFNKALTITGGYTGVPGSRSLVNTFPFFTSTDRTTGPIPFCRALRRASGPTGSW